MILAIFLSTLNMLLIIDIVKIIDILNIQGFYFQILSWILRNIKCFLYIIDVLKISFSFLSSIFL